MGGEEVQCKKVNNWMMALAGGGPSDVPLSSFGGGHSVKTKEKI